MSTPARWVRLLILVSITVAVATFVPTTRAGSTPITIAEFDFDGDLGAADPQGWRPVSIFTVDDAYFHVEDFSGTGHTATTLSGNASMWCGLTTEDPRTCFWQSPPGYGNGWRQNLTSVEFAVQGDVTLAFLMDVAIEDSYDFVFVQYENLSGTWTTVDAYSCGFFVSPCGPLAQSYVVPATAHDGTLRFRFFFSSDGAISNSQNFGFAPHIAFVLDDLTVSDTTGVVDFQDFESEAINDQVTTDGDWFAEENIDALLGIGDEIVAGGMVNGNAILQESPTLNLTNFWAFLEGSTSDYGCAGHPEQATTPQTNTIVRSPRIDLTHDIDGYLITGDVDSVWVSFDVYRDIPESIPGQSLLVSYTARVDFYSDCFEGAQQISGRGEQKDWFRHSMALAPPTGTTEIVVQLGLDNPFPDGTYCNSHSPLFDNVTVERAGDVVTAAGISTPSNRRFLRQNRPNPFNPATVIEFQIPTDGEQVRLRLFDASGRILRTLIDGTSSRGRKSVTWDGTDGRGRPMASGVYFYELSVGGERETRRMVLLK